MVSTSFLFAQEQITITTYYPSPYGVYRELRSQRQAVGDTYYDSSQHCWPGGPCSTPDINADADLVVEGNVGIGTTSPSEKLEVIGNLKIDGIDSGIIFPDRTKQTTAAAFDPTKVQVVTTSFWPPTGMYVWYEYTLGCPENYFATGGACKANIAGDQNTLSSVGCVAGPDRLHYRSDGTFYGISCRCRRNCVWHCGAYLVCYKYKCKTETKNGVRPIFLRNSAPIPGT